MSFFTGSARWHRRRGLRVKEDLPPGGDRRQVRQSWQKTRLALHGFARAEAATGAMKNIALVMGIIVIAAVVCALPVPNQIPKDREPGAAMGE